MKKGWVAGALCSGVLLAGAQAASAQDTTFKLYWKDGIRADSADGNFKIKIGGRLHWDAAFFDAEKGLETANGKDFDNGVEARRARFEIDATVYERFIFKTQYDFVEEKAKLKDMFMGVTGVPWLGTVRIGNFKEFFSLDELTSSKYDELMEQGLNTAFAPSRNPGIGFQNAVLDERMTYALGVFIDGDEGGTSQGQETWAVTGRVTGLPWYAEENKLLHLGLGFTHRSLDDTVQFRQRPSSHIAPYVVDTGKITADGFWALDPEISFVYGPFNVQAEYTFTSVDSSTAGDPEFGGYYVQGSWFITGESRNYKPTVGEFDRVKPKVNFLQAGGLGAWQLIARYDGLDLNDGAVAGGEMNDVTVGVHWYWNPNMSVDFNYVNSDVENEGSANIFQTRFRVDF